jgi:hypothetical protein
MTSNILTIPVHVYLSCTDPSGEPLTDDLCIDAEMGNSSGMLVSVKFSDLLAGYVSYSKANDNYMDKSEARLLRICAHRAELAALELESEFLSSEASCSLENHQVAGIEKKIQDAMIAAGMAVLQRHGVSIPAPVMLAAYESMVVTGAECIDNHLNGVPGWTNDEVRS